ncbi:MAG: DUF1232 domain-containing protein [Actinobacteria bacterium]|nr:DUF1232 domain-containing protein [Actinomycetota bacterium]
MRWIVISLAACLVLYLLAVLSLVVAGRRGDARALARFIPDCAVLVRRLLVDPAVPRGRKVLLVGLLAYLVSPIDLVPDFIPVAGQLDDAILTALVLRAVLRGSTPERLADAWPGPPQGLSVVVRLAFGGAGRV